MIGAKKILLGSSKVGLIMFLLLSCGFIIAGGITSSEVDDVCAKNEALLQRFGGQWKCFIQSHSSMFNYSANDTAWTFPITTANVYYNLSGLSNLSHSGFNFSTDAENGSVLVLNGGADGHYLVIWSMSFEADGGDALYAVTAVKNGNKDISRNCYSRRWAKKANVGSISGVCTLALVTGDDVRLQVENEDNNRNIKVHTVSFNINRIH